MSERPPFVYPLTDGTQPDAGVGHSLPPDIAAEVDAQCGHGMTQPTDHVEADTRCPRCDTVTTWRGTRHTPGDSTDYSSGIDCCGDEEGGN